MSDRFSPNAPSIRLTGIVKGPQRETAVRMILDTGATQTILTWEVAIVCGYDPTAATRRLQMITASGFETCPEIVLSEFVFLERRLRQFPVLCHPLPASLRADGVVGLDFFRGAKLTIDFRVGEVSLGI